MKFKVEVSKVYLQTHIVEADDEDHANEIAKEIDDVMRTNWETYWESEWKVKPVSDDTEITYEPEQDYLK